MPRAWDVAYVSTSRGVFELFTAGEGPPLCATHGYSAFNATGDYFAECFAPHRTVYLVNLRGAGHSAPPSDEHDLGMGSAVRDLEALRRALRLPRWDFAGHSTGGMVGLLYAVSHPEALSSLTVVGAAASRAYNRGPDCVYHPKHPAFGRMQALIEALKGSGLSEGDRTRLARERTQLSLHHPELYDRYFDGRVIKEIAGARLEHFARYDYPAFDVRERLRGLIVPTLVIGGRHDVQCPYWCSREIGELIPGAPVVEFAESNHYPFLEEAEKFRTVVAAFLHGRLML